MGRLRGRGLLLVSFALGSAGQFALDRFVLGGFDDEAVVVNVDVRCCVDVENGAILASAVGRLESARVAAFALIIDAAISGLKGL